ncbi:MAG: hypothetical protein JWL69_3804 [Phycisphaerales bacterium]|nr:hypothetical protein [Phycisphaerales bacterium]MDB5354543.1 hypothetical protein [Phycisphaerales bacterium]
MGQATLDLPDPLDVPAVAGSADTDDLIAQLAGDEIDRLMADSDREAPAADAQFEAVAHAPAPPVATAPARPAGEKAPPSPKSPSVNGAARTKQPATAPSATPIVESPANAPEPAPAESLSEADLAAGIDAVFSKIAADEPKPGSEAAQASTQGSIDPPARKVSVAQAAIHAVEAEGLAGDQSLVPQSDVALMESSLAAAPSTDLSDPEPTEADLADMEAEAEKSELSAPIPHDDLPETNQPTPMLVRVLELFNSPLSACPESVREAMGKVAVITLVNALAVLAYVLIFRRR